MNSYDSVVYKKYDESYRTQIFLFKDGINKKITTFKSNDFVAIKDQFSMNDKEQVIWVQSQIDEDGSYNEYVMLYDPIKDEIIRISNLVGEKYNTCAVPTINENGDIAWYQRGGNDTINKLFVYNNGLSKEIFQTANDIRNPNINNNGYVVYSLSDYPGSVIHKVFL